MSKNKPVNYINNKQFYEAMVKYRDSVLEAEREGKPKPRVPNYIGHCIMQIGERLSYKYQFRSYSYREELVYDGIEACIRYIDNFNPDKSTNPFAYFTQVTYNAFINRLNREQEQQYIKARLMKEMRSQTTTKDDITDSDPMNDVITAFERRIASKKARAAEAKARKLAEKSEDLDIEDLDKFKDEE